ncbi:hypothetical protein D5S18_33125 [Nocardia panacis]|uniref:Uncharacterized protein n=1 Tax=Nocardia panacis TaxID=2340916 RepID=A0A3A4K5S0_9NOCA|nr:hypothetical protein D5S18_33125 [Nocardia panacis]
MQQPFPSPPPYQQPPAYPQPPAYQPNQAYQPSNPYYQANPVAPKSNAGVFIGVVLGLVVLLGLGIGAVAYVTRDKESTNAAEDTFPTLPPETTFPPTNLPTPTFGRPTGAPKSPTGARLGYAEYGGKDWDFKYADIALHADWVSGRDHDTCASIEKQGKLTALGCTYAAELVYKAEGGGLMLTQFILGMADADKAAAAMGKFSDRDLSLRKGTFVDNFTTGKWKDGSQKSFVVITIATAKDAVDPALVQKYLHYRNADTLGALIWR